MITCLIHLSSFPLLMSLSLFFNPFASIIVIIVTLVMSNYYSSYWFNYLILIIYIFHVIDFIQNLIKEEQQLEAIKYICALELVDKFPPLPLLNDHFINSKRKAEELCKKGNNSLSVQVYSSPFCLLLYVLPSQTSNHLFIVHICS